MTTKCILFDLDGTLVDTAPDLGAALNSLLIEDGRKPLDAEVMRPYSSQGSRGLLRLGYGINQEDSGYTEMRERYLKVYAENLCNDSVVFEGINELLLELDTLGIAWGVVTNKPSNLANPLMDQLTFATPPACIIGADQVPKPKPDPAALELACELTGFHAENCIYVGDARRDIVAGCRAGMRTVAVTYGYIQKGDFPDQWGADRIINQPSEILDCLIAEAA